MKTAALLSVFLLLSNTAGAQHQEADTAHKSSLQEVTVSASASRLKQQIESTQMGRVELPVTLLLKAPSIGGEPDIIKALQLTPGVKQGTEGTIGMYVRGGGNDENLVLMDGAPVYNAGHLLGFFSVFNAASVKDAQLYKSSFPARYSGRLSSVLDVRTKEGSLTEYKGSASIGLIASSLSVQGPILKDKLSFMIATRRTYIDKVLPYIPYHFYDINSKLTWAINRAHRLSVSGYKGNDILKMNTTGRDSANGEYTLKSGMKLGNQTASLRWSYAPQHSRYTTDLTLLYTKFHYNITGSMGANALSMRSAIRDLGVRGDVKLAGTGDHQLAAGFSLINHYFNPNIVSTTGAQLEQFANGSGRKIYNNEAGIYLGDDCRLSSRLQVQAGLRLSADIGQDQTYVHAEPRLALRYLTGSNSSVKVSYARMVQYMHLVSSSSVTLPTDLWYPVTANLKPGLSDQVSAGCYKAFPDQGISFSAEAYYKWMRHLVEYREGALLIMNEDYEQELVQGEGRSYGLELFASKTTGRFTGWVGYALSYAHRRFDSLNSGREYYARYDRRHDFSFTGMYDVTRQWAVSTTMLYATGSPFTGQTGQYLIPKPDLSGFEPLPTYTTRNELRMSAAFRVDLDIQYRFAVTKRIKGDVHLSCYNLLNRTQPHSVQRTWSEARGEYTYQQKGLFGTITAAAVNFNL